jgi:hypothetical protein
MITFTATIKKFEKQGEKTGWTYIEIPAAIAEQLTPGTKTSFRVKGMLDSFAIKGIALLPMGGGAFIMALNATLRKGIKKPVGATLQVQLRHDPKERELPAGFMESLADEPAALAQYGRLSKSHKGYFTIWITSVKSDAARAKRMAQAVNALAKGQDFGQMVRSLKKDRNDLFQK